MIKDKDIVNGFTKAYLGEYELESAKINNQFIFPNTCPVNYYKTHNIKVEIPSLTYIDYSLTYDCPERMGTLYMGSQFGSPAQMPMIYSNSIETYDEPEVDTINFYLKENNGLILQSKDIGVLIDVNTTNEPSYGLILSNIYNGTDPSKKIDIVWDLSNFTDTEGFNDPFDYIIGNPFTGFQKYCYNFYCSINQNLVFFNWDNWILNNRFLGFTVKLPDNTIRIPKGFLSKDENNTSYPSFIKEIVMPNSVYLIESTFTKAVIKDLVFNHAAEDPYSIFTLPSFFGQEATIYNLKFKNISNIPNNFLYKANVKYLSIEEDSLETIENNCFCHLGYVGISATNTIDLSNQSSLRQIGNNCFFCEPGDTTGGPRLVTTILKLPNKPANDIVITESSFNIQNTPIRIEVHPDRVEEYKAANIWSNIANYIYPYSD